MNGSAAFSNKLHSFLDGSYALVGIGGLLLYSALSYFTREHKVVTYLPPLSLWKAFQYLKDARGIHDAGMKKWPRRIFKVLTPAGWQVILTEPSVIDEVRKAPDDIMNLSEAFNRLIQTKWTIGSNVTANPYHVPVIRVQLRRALPRIIPEIHEEIILSFDQYIPVTESWTRVKVSDAFRNIIARTSNRAIVGVPLCRDPGWIDIGVGFTKEVITTSLYLRFSPSILHPWIYKRFSKIPDYRSRVSRYLAPLIAARQKERENSDSEKPHDILTWLMDEAQGEEATLPFLVLRILLINFASLHTTFLTFTYILYYLAAYPEYIQALREEAEEVTKCKGWTKDALDEMHKIDSFIRESQRLNPVGLLAMHRCMLQDYTFLDGTTVPAGSSVAVCIDSAHRNGEIYSDPLRFDGFRFIKMREEAISSGNPNRKFDIVSISTNNLTFGIGKHACPGRFFVAYELKQMLAHIVLNYDVKFENDGAKPLNKLFMEASLPDHTAEVLFRKRKE